MNIQPLPINNQYGTFSIKIGDHIACHPFPNDFFQIVALYQHSCDNIITIVDNCNNYDTRTADSVKSVK